MCAIKAGEPAIQADVERILRILAAGNSSVSAVALVVNRLRPSVRTEEVQAMGETLFNFGLQPMIDRMGAVRKLTDLAECRAEWLPQNRIAGTGKRGVDIGC